MPKTDLSVLQRAAPNEIGFGAPGDGADSSLDALIGPCASGRRRLVFPPSV